MLTRKRILLTVALACLAFFVLATVAGAADDWSDSAKKKNQKGKQADKPKAAKPAATHEPFLKPQNRRGLAIGPRIGAFIPTDGDFADNVPLLVQAGLDLKGYIIPWVAVNFGVGVAGGGSGDTYEDIPAPTVTDADRTKSIDVYYLTTMVPITLGVTGEALPRGVFNPYGGFGGGLYYVTMLEPLPRADLLDVEDYESDTAPAEFTQEAMFGWYVVAGVDIKFHDYMGIKLEGSYHGLTDSTELASEANPSGIMISLGSFVFF